MLLLLLPVMCLGPIFFGPKAQDFIDRIPLRSKLSELDTHLGKGFERRFQSSEVEAWLPAMPGSPGARTTSKYGSFHVKALGSYEALDLDEVELKSFTGEVRFYKHSSVVPDDLAPSYVIALTYVEGVLVEKEYGHLPG